MLIYRARGNQPGEEQWFTSELSVAQNHGGDVVYLDLPDSYCKKIVASGEPGHEYLVPEGWLYHVREFKENV